MKQTRRIAIITRLDNTNAGNEALSSELLKLATKLDPQASVMAVNRYPRYFEHLTLSRLGTDDETAVRRFDELASRLLNRLNKPEARSVAPYDTQTVKLRSDISELPQGIRRVKNLIGLRRNLARFGLIERQEAVDTVSLCSNVDLLVWNPAGEFHPTGNPHQTFRLLLMIRMAQLRRVSTAIVNHSLEISDQMLRTVVGHVYRHCSHVCVRDPRSKEILLSLGVPAHKVSESPDLVFLASEAPRISVSSAEAVPEGAIGLAINAAEAFRGTDEWEALLTGLKEFNRPIVFLSNAMNGDCKFGTELMTKWGGSIVPQQPSYLELREMYGKMSVLISSRLHASILALCADTPIITLEPSVFKLTAILQQLAYPIATDRLAVPGWSGRVIKNVQMALANHEALVKYAREALMRQVDDIYRSYRPILLPPHSFPAQQIAN